MLRVIAKGAHRRTKAGASKFDGGVDLLDLGAAVFTYDTAKDLQTLTEWHLVDGHLDMRRNLRAIYLSQYAAELIGTLFEEHDPHPDLFDRLQGTLEDFSSQKVEESFASVQMDILRESGYLPELGACVQCGRAVSDAAAFSASRGGIICRSCEGATPDRTNTDPRLVRLMQNLLRLPPNRLPRLTRHQTDPINRLLAEHIEHTLGKRLRLPRYILGRRGSTDAEAASRSLRPTNVETQQQPVYGGGAG